MDLVSKSISFTISEKEGFCYAKESKDKNKINIDENQKTPAKYGVMSIPTLILYKNGEVKATRMGLMSKSELSAFIDSNI